MRLASAASRREPVLEDGHAVRDEVAERAGHGMILTRAADGTQNENATRSEGLTCNER
jgi:hypothetical protein